MMLIGKPGEPRAEPFCALGDAREFNVRRDVGVADILQRIATAPVIRVTRQRSARTLRVVKFLAAKTIIDRQNKSAFQLRQQ